MKKILMYVSNTIDNGIHTDVEYKTEVEITSYDNKTILEYIDNENAKNILTATSNYINIKRYKDTESSLDLILDKNTLYNLKTVFGDISLGIYTLDILINNDFIYAKYYIEPDTSIYHEIKITLLNE